MKGVLRRNASNLVPPSKRAVSATVVQSSKKRLLIDADLLRIVISTANELSGGNNINDLERH